MKPCFIIISSDRVILETLDEEAARSLVKELRAAGAPAYLAERVQIDDHCGNDHT